jgi:preprotein translocase subunit SecG
MAFLIGLVTFIMVVDCAVLVFLVLIQLPKKEAGAGLAFGGAASDALFGAGSGTVLTKITKYAAGLFFILSIGLSLMQSAYFRQRGGGSFLREIAKPGKTAALPAPPSGSNQASRATAPPAAATPAPGTNALMSSPGPATNLLISTPAPAATNPAAPAPTPTNAAPAPKK